MSSLQKSSASLITGSGGEERKEKAVEIAQSQFHTSTFDTIIIVGETSIGIEQIRDLQHQLNLKPYNSPYKAAILHPAELLTIEAQNAILKTLEEPNETSVLILTAPQPESLLPTIVSRCQIIKLPTNYPARNASHSDAGGQLLSTLINAGVGERLKFASTVGKSKEEIKAWLENLLTILREILLHPRHPDVTSGSVSMIRSLTKTLSYLESNANPRLCLEIFLLDLAKSPDVAKLGNSRC